MMGLPRPTRPVSEDGIRYERAAYYGFTLPSQSTSLVRNPGGRSTHLPTRCDICQRIITDYPFVTKGSGHRKHQIRRLRKYHLACALNIGLVSLTPMKV
jgi:hypothetical protein